MRWSTPLAVALALAASLTACRQTVVLDPGDGGGAGSGGSFGGGFGGGFGGFGAGGTSDAGPPSSFCAGGMTKTVVAAPETPDIIVALDRSSSMNTPLTGSQSRVDAALQSLYDVVQRYQTSVRFGYIGFPATANSTCSNGQACCAEDSNFMIPTSMGFQSFLNKTTCDATTPQCARTADRPTDAALHSCRYFYSNYELTVRNRFVLLITDGEPGCGSRSECSDATSEISTLTGSPTLVDTVVIGIGDSGASCLTMLATTGGNHNPQNAPYYYHASSGLDLANFINEAVGDLAQSACTIDLIGNLPSNSDRLGVSINGVPIMHGGGYDSWDYQGQDKTTIKLSGNACTEFLAAGAAALRLVSCSMGPP
jgi:hypothetical protein